MYGAQGHANDAINTMMLDRSMHARPDLIECLVTRINVIDVKAQEEAEKSYKERLDSATEAFNRAKSSLEDLLRNPPGAVVHAPVDPMSVPPGHGTDCACDACIGMFPAYMK